jgi:hypothetical protein
MYFSKPSPRMSTSNRIALSFVAKSMSSGGGDENPYPTRLGTIRWTGNVSGVYVLVRCCRSGMNSRTEPGHPCVAMTGTASGLDEKRAMK